jgi:hypothetical protein
MEIESIPVGDINLVERKAEDNLLGVFVLGEEGRIDIGLKAILARALSEVDNLIASCYALVPLGGACIYFGIQIHLGKQGIGCPLVKSAIIVATGSLAQVADVFSNLTYNKVIDFLACGLLWQVGILEVSHDRYIAIKVAMDVVITGAKHLEL